MYFLRYSTSSAVNRLPPYVLLMTRLGGVGERACGLWRFITSVDAGGAGAGCEIRPHENDDRGGNKTEGESPHLSSRPLAPSWRV